MPEGFMLNRFCLNNDCCKFGNKVKITSDVVTYFQVHKRINRFGIIWGKEYQYLSMWNFNQTCETAMHALGPLPSFYRVSSKCRGDLSKEKKFSTACPKIKLPQLGQGPRLSHRTDEVHPTLPGWVGGTKILHSCA